MPGVEVGDREPNKSKNKTEKKKKDFYPIYKMFVPDWLPQFVSYGKDKFSNLCKLQTVLLTTD